MSTPAELADLAQGEQLDAVAAFEQDVVEQAVADADSLLAEAVAAATALWLAKVGTADAVATGKALADVLTAVGEAITAAVNGLVDRTAAAIRLAVPEAVRLGGDLSAAFTRAAGRRVPKLAPAKGTEAVAAREAAQAQQAITEQLGVVTRLLGARPDTLPAVLAVHQAARGAVTRARAAVSGAVQRAVDRGAVRVAKALGVGRLWVAEPDACLRCSAYSGQLAAPGQAFDGGLSFDPDYQGGDEQVDGPPLHPNCRCRTVPWGSRWPSAVPELLRQRAAEHVAAGDALPSESGAARVRAAAAVIRSGRRLPPRVLARARRAVEEGRFPRPQQAS